MCKKLADCGEISDKNERYECYYYLIGIINYLASTSNQDINLLVKGISKICSEISNEDKNLKDQCYSYRLNLIALSNQNIENCNKISNKGIANKCYYDLASLKHDPSICDKISDEPTKTSCIVGFTTSGNLSICDKITDQFYKDECYHLTALSDSDLVVCDKITDQEIKDICYYEISVSITNPDQILSVCHKIIGQSAKEGCYNDLTFLTQDPSLCGNIQSEESRIRCNTRAACDKIVENVSQQIVHVDDVKSKEACYSQLAYRRNDPSICDKIVDYRYERIRDSCFYEIGVFKNNLLACEKIISLKMKNECERSA